MFPGRASLFIHVKQFGKCLSYDIGYISDALHENFSLFLSICIAPDVQNNMRRVVL